MQSPVNLTVAHRRHVFVLEFLLRYLVVLIQVKRSRPVFLPSRGLSTLSAPSLPLPGGPRPWWRGGRGGSRWCSRPRRRSSTRSRGSAAGRPRRRRSRCASGPASSASPPAPPAPDAAASSATSRPSSPSPLPRSAGSPSSPARRYVVPVGVSPIEFRYWGVGWMAGLGVRSLRG